MENALMKITDEMVEKAYATFCEALNSTGPCEKCQGHGYHHGFGEGGHSPDWCVVCGGAGFMPTADDKTAMRLALEAVRADTETGQAK